MTTAAPKDRMYYVVNTMVYLGVPAHAAFVPLFLYLELPGMALFNVLSVAVWAAGWWLNRHDRHALALSLMTLESTLHSVLATWFLGFDSGFQYYLFSILPAMMFNARLRRAAVLPIALMLGLVFIGLDMHSALIDPERFDASILRIVNYANILVVFTAVGVIAFYFRMGSEVIEEAAEAANLAKSRFLAVASHDLRQPMHALNLYLGSLAGLDLAPAARRLLTHVRQCADTMDEMFRALLDVSRLDAAVVQPEVHEFAIAGLLERLRVEFEPEAHAKGVELRVASSSAFVRSDPALVGRILRNLTANAVRYTDSGKVLIGCRRRGKLLRITVLDTGPGIPPAQRRAVFEEFYQASNPERDRARGLGLGLAIVDRLSRLLATPITLASRPGRGSAFALDVPRAEAAEQVREVDAPLVAADPSLENALIAVIDDEKQVLDGTRSLLEQWGCTVITAGSKAEAMANLSESPRTPDALMCDYRLRGEENGLDVIEALRTEFNADIPAMLVTGDTAPERIREIEASGLPVLHKPLTQEALSDALARLVSADRDARHAFL